MSHDLHRTAVFTIVAKNYLAHARTLMASLAAIHPEWQRVVFLADRSDGHFDPAAESFEVCEAETLPLPDRQAFLFRYTLLELSTAVKPWCFRELFDRGFDRVLYLDPDILLYAPLDEMARAWDRGALAVLTPHLTGRIRDALWPGERDILKSGTYNLGFLALGRHADLDGLLEFWSDKSVREFFADPAAGFFTDQKWMDLVPGLFSGVEILRHEGYNVAYWNLPHRTVVRSTDRYDVNGVPLVFFHFSGLSPADPDTFSRHQNRYRLSDGGLVGDLVRDYCARVYAQGFSACRRWPYAYERLHDGTAIRPEWRRLVDGTPGLGALAGPDPFALDRRTFEGPSDEGNPPLSWAMRALHAARVDLQFAFPDPVGRDREAFTTWFAHQGDASQTLPVAPAPARPQLLPSLDAVRPALLASGARKAMRAIAERRLPLSPRYWLQMLEVQANEEAQKRARQAATAAPRPEPAPALPNKGGLTIGGYLSDATGVGYSAHGAALACQAAGIPHDLVDARTHTTPRAALVNLLCVNADQIPIVGDLLGQEFFRNKYTIAQWAWELDAFPDAYGSSFGYVDEVWAPSTFIMRAVAAKAPVPVVHMPYAVRLTDRGSVTRADLGLPSRRFLFLVAYDMLSIQERKNPLGAIEAFQRAFPNSTDVTLVVKVNHASSASDDLRAVKEALHGMPDAMLIDRPFSRAEMAALHMEVDAYVSLHRSEGFGLNIAEAMLAGKPVIATHYSGNADFMHAHNSCPVDYRLIALERDFGPYMRGQRWADPDLHQAAAYMKRVVEDADYRARIGRCASRTMAEDYSPTAIGRLYRERLAVIGR